MTSVNSRIAIAHEPVRLVVWDLDETFWRGTLTEGGISEYVRAHHDAVIELARRGVMSSICSRNNPDQVLPILEDKKILEYFIFPSISWRPKGERLAALIESVQLRPASVMFIDDNPGNLAEACAMIPGIQVEGVDFIGRMLEDPRLKGKNDSGLTRLAQYKLLETRKRDEVQHSGDNSAFLRGCDIRVFIEHDVLGHLDRAVELINRTNQLNYTKNRLPEDPKRAQAKLSKKCIGSHRQAGLVRVVDRYGDYGFVGFYLMRNRRADPAPGLANQTLIHYCFSCRTLGMFVEHWLYDQLRRPALEVVGEVLTDLNEARTIDWIRLVPSISEDAQAAQKLAPEIRVTGGCEANSVAHYLGAYCDKVAVTGNFQAGALFVRVNSCFLLLSAVDHTDRVFEEEMALLGISAPLLGTDYFRDAPEGTIFVFNGGMDAFGAIHRVRHRLHGWEIHATSGDSADFVSGSAEDIARLVAEAKSDAERRQLEFATRHIRENYETVGGDSGSALESAMEELVRRVPQGCKLVILLDDERRRSKRAGVRIKRERVRYNEWARSFAARFPFVGVTSFSDAIQSEDEILQGGNHYARMVYWRAAEKIVEVARQIGLKERPESHSAVGDGIAQLEEPIKGNLRTHRLQLERI
jgi:FkbH-like protein